MSNCISFIAASLPLFVFGTIACMRFGQRIAGRIPIPWILTAFLVFSCSPVPPAPIPDSVPLPVVTTLTPFQPRQPSAIDLALEPLTAQVEPTFTPYPTKSVNGEYLSAPILVTPAQGAMDTKHTSTDVNNPLTGLPVGDPALLERRPMAIKIANAPDTIRPQSGLSLADVVFEYYIEWGDTRFIAVMYGNDSPMVGPVRSGRYFDEHVARMYNAFLMFKFADPREYSYLQNSTLNEFLVVPGNGPCPPYVFGPYKRDDYNNFFFDTIKWANCASKMGLDNSKQNLRGGFFADFVVESDLAAARIYFYFSRYSYNYWDYDPAIHKYFRYQEANDILGKNSEAYAPLSDAQTGLPVTAENVVVLFAPYTFANRYDAHDEVYHIDLIDSGSAYVFRDGYAVPAIWKRADKNQPLLLTTLTGVPIYLRPGRTFYEVMGVTSTHTHDATGWRFEFKTP